ncbi:hypothetical protein DXT99_02330 [Pontibacter diazotrophicus]|uniref:Outer membrane protein beta-barrel domain-containing protein n=1 Tax=Pontibacter diazotrophicus TaxID=1400979 RepID=A0A3D8LID7_9BACT|nr:hypothetical protein [Pontibacter diazotrophicus]RDV16642.1 hypothetical protein DXT99_02330 [Pontibacter diazotrophicus]
MRKLLFLTFTVSLLSCSQVMAQVDTTITTTPRLKHEVYAGYGVLSFPLLLEGIVNLFGTGGETNRGVGPVQVGYNYLLNEKWSVGVLNSYTSYTSRYTSSGQLIYRNHYYCVMPRIDGYWVREEKLLLYSGVAVGAMIFRGYDGELDEKSKGIYAVGHLNVMGLRVGKELAFFADFGFGFNGLINTGVSARF